MTKAPLREEGTGTLSVRATTAVADPLSHSPSLSVLAHTSTHTHRYGCPPEGGKLYIPGFGGALHCPNAKEFCLMEDVSGRLYGETPRWLEWVLMFVPLGVGTVALLGVIGCLAVPCIRRSMSGGIKLVCAVYMLKGECRRTSRFVSARERYKEKHVRSCASKVLLVSNSAQLAAGVALMALGALGIIGISLPGVYDSLPAMGKTIFGAGLSCAGFSVVALMAAKNDEPSVKLLAYFGALVAICLAVGAVAVGFYGFRQTLDNYMGRKWEKEKSKAPDSWQGLDHEGAIAKMDETIVTNLWWLIPLAIVAAVAMVAHIVLALRILTTRVVARNALVSLNVCVAAFAIAMISLSGSVFGLQPGDLIYLYMWIAPLLLVEALCGYVAAVVNTPLALLLYAIAAFAAVAPTLLYAVLNFAVLPDKVFDNVRRTAAPPHNARHHWRRRYQSSVPFRPLPVRFLSFPSPVSRISSSFLPFSANPQLCGFERLWTSRSLCSQTFRRRWRKFHSQTRA